MNHQESLLLLEFMALHSSGSPTTAVYMFSFQSSLHLTFHLSFGYMIICFCTFLSTFSFLFQSCPLLCLCLFLTVSHISIGICSKSTMMLKWGNLSCDVPLQALLFFYLRCDSHAGIGFASLSICKRSEILYKQISCNSCEIFEKC